MTRILGMGVEIDVFKLPRRSIYIELPQKLKATKAVINVTNNDSKDAQGNQNTKRSTSTISTSATLNFR